MDDEIKKVLFEVGISHAILASEEYKRDTSYNDSHFSAKAEHSLIELFRKHGLLEEFLGKLKGKI